MIKASLSIEQLTKYISIQINNNFPDINKITMEESIDETRQALRILEKCFLGLTKRKYYCKNNKPLFNHLHSDQYALFLYLLSRQFYQNGKIANAEKTFYLNKIMHSIDVFYEVELPSICVFSHCNGTVLGRAKYNDYFAVSQNCTIGNNKGIYPTFGEAIVIFKGATVIGNSSIGSNTYISANTLVKDQNIPDNSIVFGSSPNLIVKKNKNSVIKEFFKD